MRDEEPRYWSSLCLEQHKKDGSQYKPDSQQSFQGASNPMGYPGSVIVSNNRLGARSQSYQQHHSDYHKILHYGEGCQRHSSQHRQNRSVV